MITARQVTMYPTRNALNQAVGELLLETIAAGGEAPHALMLSGGSTPWPAYEAVAKRQPKTGTGLHLMFADDRHVAADSPASNFGNCRPLIEGLGLPAERVLHVRGDLELDAAAADYARQIADFEAKDGELPLGILGLGEDGHTCSIFSLDDAARTDQLAFAVPSTAGFDRVSVSRAVLLRTRRLVFMVSGAGKQAILQDLVNDPQSLPAGRAVAGHPRVEVWTDQVVG